MTRNKWLLVILLILALLAGFALYGDVSRVKDEFTQFHWWYLGPALALASTNFLVRFVKWEYFLRVLKHRVDTKRSASVFFSGLAMSVTPGKLGEVLKAYLLRTACGVPMQDTVPVVVAERLTDLISVVLLASFGVAGFSYGLNLLIAAALLCGMVVGLALWTRGFRTVVELLSRVSFIGKRKDKLLELQHAMVKLVGIGPLAVGSLLGLVAWAAECLAFHVILHGVGIDARLEQSFFIYALGTIAGALAMLPGGLLATEASMVAMLVELLAIATPSQGVTAVFLVRLCTLWWAVAVGGVALALNRRLTANQPIPESLTPSSQR